MKKIIIIATLLVATFSVNAQTLTVKNYTDNPYFYVIARAASSSASCGSGTYLSAPTSIAAASSPTSPGVLTFTASSMCGCSSLYWELTHIEDRSCGYPYNLYTVGRACAAPSTSIPSVITCYNPAPPPHTITWLELGSGNVEVDIN